MICPEINYVKKYLEDLSIKCDVQEDPKDASRLFLILEDKRYVITKVNMLSEIAIALAKHTLNETARKKEAELATVKLEPEPETEPTRPLIEIVQEHLDMLEDFEIYASEYSPDIKLTMYQFYNIEVNEEYETLLDLTLKPRKAVEEAVNRLACMIINAGIIFEPARKWLKGWDD